MKLAEIFIMGVGTAEKVFKIRVKRSESRPDQLGLTYSVYWRRHIFQRCERERESLLAK